VTTLGDALVSLALEEGDRQIVLLALAVLSLANPGFDQTLNALALRIDNADEHGRARMYDVLRRLRQGEWRCSVCGEKAHVRIERSLPRTVRFHCDAHLPGVLGGPS
jgi:hypothetical protein